VRSHRQDDGEIHPVRTVSPTLRRSGSVILTTQYQPANRKLYREPGRWLLTVLPRRRLREVPEEAARELMIPAPGSRQGTTFAGRRASRGYMCENNGTQPEGPDTIQERVRCRLSCMYAGFNFLAVEFDPFAGVSAAFLSRFRLVRAALQSLARRLPCPSP